MNWKRDFPALRESSVIFCDNAATTHKPQQMIDAVANFYARDYAPIYRGIYTSAEKATRACQQARQAVADFIGADTASDIVFTKSATESVNIVAWSWAWHIITAEDEIVISDLEHHAHYVTWQRFATLKGCTLRRIPVTKDGELDTNDVARIIHWRTKVVAISAQSNVIGVPIDVEPIRERAHACGAYLVCDASQKAPRAALQVRSNGYDFCIISPHKMLGPTGLGVLYVAPEHHDEVAPYMYGGGMVHKVTEYTHAWKEMPYRCEGGSPPSAQVIGYHAALSYLQETSLTDLARHEAALCRQLVDGISQISGYHIVGPREKIRHSGHIVSLYHDQYDAQDIAAFLDMYHICVRSGHHCAQPLHRALGIKNTLRISLYGYNSHEDIEYILLALKRLVS